jgi:ubiquinone/menaquinone biosynthesis C-methylase UbiE
MQVLDRLIGQQIRKPSGFLGRLLGHLMAADHRGLTDWTLDQLRIENNDVVLDIGCGSGLAIKKIHGPGRRGYGVGMDYSSAMLRQAARRNRLMIQEGKISLCYADISALPFEDAAFDKVCSIETFYFWPHPTQDLQEMKRVLRPGGRLAISMEMSKEGRNRAAIEDNARRLGFSIYSGEEMLALLSATGFVHVDYKAIPEREKGWLCAVASARSES